MLRSLASISHHLPTLATSSSSSSSHSSHQPKTPPSTPSLEKGVSRSTSSRSTSTSKRSKPQYYNTQEIRAWKRYTRFLHVVIVVLLLVVVMVIGGWYGRGSNCGEGEEREGRLGVLPWMEMGMGSRMRVEKAMGVEKSVMIGKDGNGDMLHAVQQCGIRLQDSEEGCLRRFITVTASSSSPSIRRGEREAWKEVRDGLEALWRGLIESECKCHNPEMLDRMYEGLRERAGEMAGEMVGVGEKVGGGDGIVLEG